MHATRPAESTVHVDSSPTLTSTMEIRGGAGACGVAGAGADAGARGAHAANATHGRKR
jgi:hypothetical protein